MSSETVLLTNHHMVGYEGSQRYTYDMARTLTELGYAVTVATIAEGPTAERLREHVEVIGTPANLGHYDLGIVHHNTIYEDVRPHCERLVYEALGPNRLEHPKSSWHDEPEAYAAVSEEMAVEIFKPVGRSIAVVPQGVPTAAPLRRIGERAERLLVLASIHPRAADWTAAAKDAGLEHEVVGLAALDTTGQRWHVRRHIERADIVVSIGRGAIEAACMGRYVIVDALHGADGPLTLGNTHESGERNYSGRTCSKIPTPGEMAEWVASYDRAAAAAVGSVMRAKHDITRVGETLLDLARGKLRATTEPYARVDQLEAVA